MLWQTRMALPSSEKRDGILCLVFHGGYSLGTLISAGAMSALFTLGIMPNSLLSKVNASVSFLCQPTM